MKKLIVLSLVAVLCLGGSSMAVVIGDFEGGSLDGWVASSPATIATDTLGATTGSGSMKFTTPGGWGPKAMRSVWDLKSLLATTDSKITMDISARSDDIPGYWCNVSILVNCDGYWNPVAGQDISVGWTQYFTTKKYEFVLPAAARTALGNAGTYAEIGIFTNSGAATFYVDNVQATIPEPATLSMLGLGALALLKRRKA
jgi:hypothetical protein